MVMMTFKRQITLMAGMALLFLLPAGCMSVGTVDSSTLRGLAIKYVRVPLTEDLSETPVSFRHCEGKIVQVKEPVSGYGIYARWSSNAILDIARRCGMERVYFADLEIFNFFGIWKHEKVYIYGE